MSFVDPREICDAEKFKPVCTDGEVVVMTDAKYGRMSIGRCVRTDYGYVSCGVNVIGYLDSKCSGRRSCELSIPDQGLKNVIAAASNSCPREFKTYLNASYDCYEGQTDCFFTLLVDRTGADHLRTPPPLTGGGRGTGKKGHNAV